MTLKYLVMPVISFALGMVSPAILAKEHSKSSGADERKAHGKQKQNADEKHQKKHHKQSNADSSRSLEQAEQQHLKSKPQKHDCNNQNCVVSKAVTSAPLRPQVNIPAVPVVNVSPAQKMVDDLIDQTAREAKQHTYEITQ